MYESYWKVKQTPSENSPKVEASDTTELERSTNSSNSSEKIGQKQEIILDVKKSKNELVNLAKYQKELVLFSNKLKKGSAARKRV